MHTSHPLSARVTAFAGSRLIAVRATLRSGPAATRRLPAKAVTRVDRGCEVCMGSEYYFPRIKFNSSYRGFPGRR